MGTRVPVQHFGMRSAANSYISSPLHDLNTVDSRPAADIKSISDVDPDAVTEDSLENDDDSNAVVSECMHESYRNPLQLHSVGVDEERTSLENNGPARGPYDILTIEGSCTFKRRELATSLETRTRFPELVIQEEKRVRFVVVNGLDIVEKPNSMSMDDAEWFKRLTGRNEVAVFARDYKFYSPRHKFRRVASSSVSNIPGLPSFPGNDNSSVLTTAQGFRTVGEPQAQQQTPCKHHLQPLLQQPQFHPVHHHNQPMHQSQHATQYSQNHQCAPTSQLPEIGHAHHSPTLSQHIACLQPLTSHVGGRLHVLPSSPAKFCDECGAQYLRETSKFCSECGAKRLGI
ncbi:uncharacterized protein At2g02148 isoform X6 [Humulus lupulus]|uniref:uncharacterized protein At2g02148 isoform X6 n=1 Tax=Humulus lupulus TaxID=3486 RepID=UPI002B407734|nr:uncharacterized protein At2g02148 isoform X6 [Humulus lupulus]